MKTFTRIVSLLLVSCVVFFGQNINAQSVLNPADPIVVYNSSAPPTQPAFGTIGKWVKTNRLSWNTSNYKSYIYKGSAFRLRFPRTYVPGVSDGKKYPMMIFFHGLGERGTIYDNEFSLYHGGQQFDQKVANGTFDGYIFVMQTQDGYWGPNQYGLIRELIDYMVINNKLDAFRVIDNGLSAGGAGTWDMAFAYPTYIAACMPMSAACACYNTTTNINNLKYTPFWVFQGGLDIAPDPYTTQQIRNAFLAAGGNFKYTEYPSLGHGVWNTAWAEADFYPFMNRANAANPWPLNGKAEFCPGDVISAPMGLAPGFSQYEWRKDGVVIASATSNTYTATSLGSYTARIRRGTVWSDVSPTPVVIRYKTPTVPPTITIPPLTSKVLPTLDTSTGVTLQVPTTFASYAWQKLPSTTTLGTGSSFYATSPGDYTVRVTEQFGCAANNSPAFTVIDANGPNKPSPATNLSVTTLSKTSLKLDWSDNPSPQFQETGYEIYQSLQSDGPYKLIALTAANAVTFNVTGLPSNVKFYYKIRGVNATAASAASNIANGTTEADVQAPTTPANLTLSTITSSSVRVTWTASTDDVAVSAYDVYVNGQKMYSTTATNFTVPNLTYKTSYNFAVRARDFAGNQSPYSNQVTAQTVFSGLYYNFYIGTWTTLPDFAALTPSRSGTGTNISLSPRTQNDNFAFLWEGYITIPTTGTYSFRTNSDAGSKVYLGALNQKGSVYGFGATAIVNNDGVHAAQNATSADIVLTAGVYPIAITFFETTGSETMTFSWRLPGSSTYNSVPNSAFADVPAADGKPPVAPLNLTATTVAYNKISLAWSDMSSDETGFEIWRSTNATSGFAVVGLSGANTTSFTDTTLTGNTTYYYRMRAINQYGQSLQVDNLPASQATWLLNNNYNDGSGNNRTLTPNGSPTFDAADKKEGTHSLLLNGTSQYVNIPSTNSFLQDAYAQKSIAFWMKSANNTGNRILVDIGGNDDGLALRLDANTLIAGVASNNTRVNFAVPYTNTTTWDHIALVYGGNSLKLYINGVEAGANNALGFNDIGTTSNGSRIGNVNSSNAFNTGTGFFSGRLDDIKIYGVALTQADVTNLMNGTALNHGQSFATTSPLPGIPAAPTALLATGTSGSSIGLSWTNNAVNATSVEVYRSNNNNTNYVLLATLPGNANSYSDAGLGGNVINYYKVRTKNIGGTSAYSNEDSAKTVNAIPVITPIAAQYMRYGSQLVLNVEASDLDGETLNIQSPNLPAFASIAPNGNGRAIITFNPQIGDQNTYNGISVVVTDQNNGTSNVSFNLVVNDNYTPVLNNVANVSLSEKQTTQINVVSSDQNVADVLTLSFTGLPDFVTPSINGGSATLNVAPGYADNGVYVVKASVSDGNNGVDTQSFTITVNDVVITKKTYVNFNGVGVPSAAAPWNNTAQLPTSSSNWPNLRDESGATGAMGLRITSAWQSMGYGDGTNDYGANTGNNSGVYPDNVMRTAYFTNENPQAFSLYGLDPGLKYNFTFFGSRDGVADDRTTVYTIGATSVSLQTANNRTNTVSINGVIPTAGGTIAINLARGASAPFGYINAMVIEQTFSDNTAPARPRNLSGSFGNNAITLNWVAAAYNADGYSVYRSQAAAGPYTLLNPGNTTPNLATYNDGNISQNNTYFYYVRAFNVNGTSPSSDTVSVTTPNVAPTIANISDVVLNASQVVDVNVSATDAASDIITLQVTGLPAFASFTDNGNGTGVLHLAPTGTDVLTYPGIVLSASDNHEGVSQKTFSIVVNYGTMKKVYLNFNDGSAAQPAQGTPWNNMNGTPTANRSISNLLDESGNNTGFGLSLAETWDGANSLGPVTGNNSGVYPDNVLRSFYYDGTGSTRHITLTGFQSKFKYNITFHGGRGDVGDTRITNYTIGSQTVSLNASNNTSNTVTISGVIPDANGRIAVSVSKDLASPFLYLNAMVIEYPFDTTFYAPVNVVATGISKDKIKVDWVKNYPSTSSFEVWRSSTANGTYQLMTTVPSTVTTYTNTDLAPATPYFYKIRAIAGARISPYSEPAGATTVTYTVKLNFNDGVSNPAQGGNWNNTNVIFNEGPVLSNMINSFGQNTGINLVSLHEFTGYNVYGTITGNNTGVYPDNVMAGFFYVNFGDTAIYQFTGLNLSTAYNFRFFGSRQTPTGGPVTTSYKIGDQVVVLDATGNTSQTVQINGVKPDANGAVTVYLYTAAGRGYVNAMEIEGSPSASSGITPPFTSSFTVITDTTSLITNANRVATANAQTPQVALANNVVLENKVSAYPNPFVDDITLRFESSKAIDRVSVLVLDMSGRTVLSKEFRNINQGISQQRLGLNGRAMMPGIYLVKIEGMADGKSKVLKLLRK